MTFPTGCTSRAGGWSRRTPTWWAAPSSSVMAPPARAPVAGVSEMPDPALTLVGGVAKGIVYLGLVLLLGLLPAAFVLGSGPSVLRRVRTVAERSEERRVGSGARARRQVEGGKDVHGL